METNELQQQLFSRLKENLPPHLSLVDELGDLLGLSTDSVYRRIRGEKPIDLIELKKICEHYHLSLDQLLQLKTESVLFDAPGMTKPLGDFAEYMKGMLAQFRYFNTFKTKEIFYLCKDAPNKTFSFEEFPYDDCFALGQQVLEEHNKINSVELWNLESIHSTINQVAYYRDAGNFRSPEELSAVIRSFHQWLDHLQLQAEKGVKFMPGATDVSYKASIQFYVNELILGNNTMVIKLDQQSLSMVTYSVFYYLFTRDPRFSAKAMGSFDTLLGRATLISKIGEKDRNRFFNALRDKVSQLEK